MACHIRAFSVHFHVSSVFFLSGVKRPSGMANVLAPRKQGAGNFVENITLVFFFFFCCTKFRSQDFLLECFYWFISDLPVVTINHSCTRQVKQFEKRLQVLELVVKITSSLRCRQ